MGELLGCGIKFHIQGALSLEIWVKTQWDMSKIRTKEVVFFNDKYVNSTIMVDLFYWNSIGSWIQLTKSYFGTFSYKAHVRPQISSNVRDSQITCAFGDSQIKPMRLVAMEILRYSR